MLYDAQITLTIPESLREIANRIGKAFDPDSGGDHTFDGEAIDGVISVTFPCIKEFAEAMPFFSATPAALHESVVRDYALRWPDLTPPTMAECEAFCAAVTLS